MIKNSVVHELFIFQPFIKCYLSSILHDIIYLFGKVQAIVISLLFRSVDYFFNCFVCKFFHNGGCQFRFFSCLCFLNYLLLKMLPLFCVFSGKNKFSVKKDGANLGWNHQYWFRG